MITHVSTDKAPAAIGPYSQAVVHDGLVYTSGQIAIDPVSGSVKGATIEEQTRQVLDNLAAVLEASGSSIGNVLKTTCYLHDMADFAAFNVVYAAVFTGKPARSTVAVRSLPKDVLVEIDAIAAVDAK